MSKFFCSRFGLIVAQPLSYFDLGVHIKIRPCSDATRPTVVIELLQASLQFESVWRAL